MLIWIVTRLKQIGNKPHRKKLSEKLHCPDSPNSTKRTKWFSACICPSLRAKPLFDREENDITTIHNSLETRLSNFVSFSHQISLWNSCSRLHYISECLNWVLPLFFQTDNVPFSVQCNNAIIYEECRFVQIRLSFQVLRLMLTEFSGFISLLGNQARYWIPNIVTCPVTNIINEGAQCLRWRIIKMWLLIVRSWQMMVTRRHIFAERKFAFDMALWFLRVRKLTYFPPVPCFWR
jgi:hypothetical protein